MICKSYSHVHVLVYTIENSYCIPYERKERGERERGEGEREGEREGKTVEGKGKVYFPSPSLEIGCPMMAI